MPNVSLVDGHIDGKQTNYDRIRNMSLEEMAEFLCDNFECDICPAHSANYCTIKSSQICSMAMEKYLESEVDTE